MPAFNGHKNRNYWNVSLWINNDEGLYNLAREAVRSTRTKDEAARYIIDALAELNIRQTPDGAPYSFSAVRAAIRGL